MKPVDVDDGKRPSREVVVLGLNSVRTALIAWYRGTRRSFKRQRLNSHVPVRKVPAPSNNWAARQRCSLG